MINQELKDLSYDEDDYECHNNPDNLSSSPKTWDDPQVRQTHIEFYLISEDNIARAKMLAQRYQEFIMRTRSSYIDVVNVLALKDRDRRDRDREELRCKIKFNELSPHSITQIEDVLDYALAIFYCCSFAGGKAGNVYHESFVNASKYYSYLSRLVNLDTIKRASEYVKAHELAELRLEASSLILKSKGHFSRYLQKAKFYSRDFRKLLEITPSDAIYYWDSPYYLTTGYDVDFSDEDHKDMLGILRDAKFKWIFSMQYKPSDTYQCTNKSDENKRRSQPHIIENYGAYYRGFFAQF